MSHETKTAMAPEVIDPVSKQHDSIAPRLIPLTDWPKYHPWPPLGGLRHMVFNGEKTGFSKVIRRVSGRVLIDEKKFFEFVNENHSDTPKPRTRRAAR